MTEEEIVVPVQLKRWSKSGLIEEARVPDQNIFQTEQFDRNDTGDLLIEDCVRRKDIVEKLRSSIEAEIKFRDRYEQGTTAFRKRQHAAFEKLAILRFVVGKSYEDIESEKPEEYLQELLDEVEQ